MARKDIEIKIRARDEASRNAKKVADALKNLGAAGDKMGSTGDKVGGALSSMAADLAKLGKERGAIDNLGKMVTQIDKTTGVIANLESRFNEVNQTFKESSARTREAAAASAELKSKLDAEVAAQKARADRVKELTDKQNKETKAILDAAAAAEKLNKALAGGRANNSGPSRASRGVGLEAGDPVKSARDSFGAFLAPEIESALGNKAALEAQVNALKAANDSAKQSITELRKAFADASKEEKTFVADTEKAQDELTKLSTKLDETYDSLLKVDNEASAAAKDLGVLALTQEDVARAADKAESELRKQAAAMAALEKYSDGAGGVANPRQAAILQKHNALVAKARDEVQSLRDEQERLDRVVKSSSGNVTAQVDAYNRVTQAIKLSEIELRKQELALRQVQGTAITGFAKWARVYNPIVTGAQQATQAQERQAQAARKSAAEAGAIAPMAQRNTSALRQQAAATDRATTSMVRFGRDTRTTLSFMQRMRGEVLALTSGFLGFYAALNRGQQAMDAFMAVQKAENRLSASFDGDTRKVATEIAFLNAEADRLGFTFEALANGYGRISIAASSAGFSIADTRRIFTSLAEAARVNGTSMDELNGVLKALDQMMSKGKVQAEELRGQLGDRMSGAFKMFADGLGMTTAQLDEAMKKGEVYADRDTLVKFADRITEKFGDQVPKAMLGLAASLGMFERDVEKVNLILANGFVPALQEALKGFNEFVNSAEGAETFRAMGEAAGDLISVLVLIPQHFDMILVAAKALLTVGVARAISSVGASALDTVKGLRDFAGKMDAAKAAGQQLTLSQRTLGAAYLSTTGALATYQARLLSSTAQTRLAAVGTRGLAASIGLLRGAIIGASTAMRLLSALLGGPIGIAIAAISVGILMWESDADKATAAMEAHERQIQEVRKAYREAGTDAKTFAEQASKSALPAAVDTLKKQMDAFEALKEPVARAVAGRLGGTIAMIRGDFGELRKMIGELTEAFMSGEIGAEEYANKLGEIYANTDDTEIREVIEASSDLTKGLVDQEKKIKTQAALVKLLGGDLKELAGYTGDVAEETDVLGDKLDDLNGTFDKSKFVEEYTAAIDKLKESIPSLAEEMKKLKEQTELNQTAWKGLVAAWNAGDYSKILEISKLWAMGTGALNEASALNVFKGISGAGGSTGALIKKFEGFRSEPYWDVNAYRAGYGSDTVTLSDGSIQKVVQGMTVTLADAERDLARRIVEFQNVVKGQIGENRFNSFNDQQQAVLTSIAYNYGSLPDRILEAVRTGSAQEIALAINSLAGDNKGVNAGRRQQEATIFRAGGNANIGVMVEAEEKRLETLKEQNEATKKTITDLDHQIAQQRLINAGKEREAAIEDAIRSAKAENPNISEQDLQAIREKTALLWEQQNAQREIELSEERINQIQSLRQGIMEQMDQARAAGDQGQIAVLQGELDGVNLRLQEAISNAIAMWQAIGGPEAEAKIANLKAMQGVIKASEQQFGLFGLTMQTWQGVFDSAINGVVGAFEAMAQAIANGENAWQAFGQAALQVLAQVLQQIAVAIIRMQILKMLQGFGGGIGEMATAMLGHTGGVVGSAAIGTGNPIRSGGWVQSALTYHTGGIAGLRPDEVSATLKKGEEILTEEDPRHRDNLGGESKAGGTERLTQVLAIGEEQINDMLQKYGGKAVITHIKQNQATIRTILK